MYLYTIRINQFLNAEVDSKEIPLPHEFLFTRNLLSQIPVLPRELPHFEP